MWYDRWQVARSIIMCMSIITFHGLECGRCHVDIIIFHCQVFTPCILCLHIVGIYFMTHFLSCVTSIVCCTCRDHLTTPRRPCTVFHKLYMYLYDKSVAIMSQYTFDLFYRHVCMCTCTRLSHHLSTSPHS